MPHFEDALLLSYSDAHLAKFILEAPHNDGIRLLSDSFVAKFCYTHQIEDVMQAVRVARQLGIRVPRVERVVEVDDQMFYIMERIKGATLEVMWPKLSLLKWHI